MFGASEYFKPYYLPCPRGKVTKKLFPNKKWSKKVTKFSSEKKKKRIPKIWDKKVTKLCSKNPRLPP
jgi:hypothetical protein